MAHLRLVTCSGSVPGRAKRSGFSIFVDHVPWGVVSRGLIYGRVAGPYVDRDPSRHWNSELAEESETRSRRDIDLGLRLLVVLGQG